MTLLDEVSDVKPDSEVLLMRRERVGARAASVRASLGQVQGLFTLEAFGYPLLSAIDSAPFRAPDDTHVELTVYTRGDHLGVVAISHAWRIAVDLTRSDEAAKLPHREDGRQP
ncbi:MAG: hypothetical protein JOY61_13415 [Chloroflexi bacterium]|nr:hypothetical protein [Chloroflexota bacterium]